MESLESRAKVNPILKEGLLNMEKCNKMSSNLLMQYKEHIIQLTNTNASLNKKVKSLWSIENKYTEVVQQNQIYEGELKNLEETVALIESQLDRKQCLKVQAEGELLWHESSQLLDCIDSIIKGKEPSVDMLLGFNKHKRQTEDIQDKEMEKTYKELHEMRKKVSDMRNTLWDHYASKYSSECNIQ